MEKQNGEIIKMTDGSPYNSMIKRGSTLFKAKCHRGHEVTYVEIDLEEYDKRVDELAKSIAKQPGIDLLALIKDALYDLPLDYLKTIESKVKKELEKPEPEIKTKTATTYRGTCVNLNVGGKNVMELRH
jgi:hypothetical protein